MSALLRGRLVLTLIASGVVLGSLSSSEAMLCKRRNGAVVVRQRCSGKFTSVSVSQAFYRYINTPPVTVGGSLTTVGAMDLPLGSYIAIVRVDFMNIGSGADLVGCYLTNGASNFGDVTNSNAPPGALVTQTYSGFIQGSAVKLDCQSSGSFRREFITLNAIAVDNVTIVDSP